MMKALHWPRGIEMMKEMINKTGDWPLAETAPCSMAERQLMLQKQVATSRSAQWKSTRSPLKDVPIYVCLCAHSFGIDNHWCQFTGRGRSAVSYTLGASVFDRRSLSYILWGYYRRSSSEGPSVKHVHAMLDCIACCALFSTGQTLNGS